MFTKSIVGRAPVVLPPDYLTKTLADVPVDGIAYIAPSLMHVDDEHRCWLLPAFECATDPDTGPRAADPLWGKTLRVRRVADGWLVDLDSAGRAGYWNARATDYAYLPGDMTFEPVVAFGPIRDDA